MNHMVQYPAESLEVVTLYQVQRNLIDDLEEQKWLNVAAANHYRRKA